MNDGALSPALAALAERVPAGTKLLALMAIATALLLVPSAAVLGGAAAVGAALGLLVLGPRGFRVAFPMGLVLTIAAVVGFTFALEGGWPALVVLLRLLALVLLAQLVTETTRAADIQDAIVSALRPFERLPFVDADKIGLALALALRSLPRLGRDLAELREACEARGLRPGPVRLVVPLIARILADARETAAAIDARSWSSRAKE